MSKADPVVAVPSIWETIELKEKAIATTFETLFAKLAPATKQNLINEIKDGLALSLAALEPIRGQLETYLGEFVAAAQLAEQIIALSAVKVST